MEELRSLCRTCGIKIHEDLATELFEECNHPLINLIEDITELWIEYDNKLPEYICNTCKVFLDQIIVFRSNCVNTHNQLMLAKKMMLQKAKEKLVSFDGGGALLPNYLDEECGDIVEPPLRECEDKDPCYAESSETLDKAMRETIQKDAKIQKNIRLPNGNLTKKQAKKVYSKTKGTWICEQCGGVFQCSTYLKLHLLRHTGKKDFECDICHGKFYTRNEMQRHRILHTNERPFACRYCGKTFRGGSSKAVHERCYVHAT